MRAAGKRNREKKSEENEKGKIRKRRSTVVLGSRSIREAKLNETKLNWQAAAVGSGGISTGFLQGKMTPATVHRCTYELITGEPKWMEFGERFAAPASLQRQIP